MERVIILEKIHGAWLSDDVRKLTDWGVVIDECPGNMPGRLVVLSVPAGKRSFRDMLGNSNFILREADYRDRRI